MDIPSKKPLPIWFLSVPIFFVSAHLLQLAVILPIEAKFLPNLTEIASIMYLPNAVRILATAIIGPRVFFALFPAILFVTYGELPPDNGLISKEIFWIAVIGAGCGPAAYFIVKYYYKHGPSFAISLQNWKPVFLIGILASLFNSVGLAIVFRNYFDFETFPLLLGKYFAGDIIGLAVGLVLLVLFFRLIRRESGPE